MKHITEFYPKRQGRPEAPEFRDLESGMNSVLSTYLFYKEEYSKVEALFERLMEEFIQKMETQTLELKQIKLHLASLSDEPIDEDSVEVE